MDWFDCMGVAVSQYKGSPAGFGEVRGSGGGGYGLSRAGNWPCTVETLALFCTFGLILRMHACFYADRKATLLVECWIKGEFYACGFARIV